MAKYRLSKSAAADLDDIFRYTIETFGLRQAERYYFAIRESCDRIAASPELGRRLRGRTQDFRQYNCGRHGIFYAIDDDGVIVVRVLHLAMDFKRHLPL